MAVNSERRTSKIRRRRGACLICKERKLRCNGERPCGNCAKSDVDCEYPVQVRQGQVHRLDRQTSSWEDGPNYDREQPRNGRGVSLSVGQGVTTNDQRSASTHELGRGLQHLRTPSSIDSAVGDCEYDFSPYTQSSRRTRKAPRYASLAEAHSSRAGHQPSFKNTLFGSRADRHRAISTTQILGTFRKELSLYPCMSHDVVQHLDALLSKVDAVLGSLGNGKSLQPLLPDNLDSKQIKSHIQEFLEKYPMSSTYVSSQKLHTIAERLSINETSLQGADKALVYSALAIGCDCPNSLERQAEATSYHKAAADQSWSVVVGAPSITKLQALATMILGSLDSDAKEDLFFLTSNAVNMIQSIGFCTISTIERVTTKVGDQSFIQSLVWIVASIEGLLTLRYGRIATLTYETIEYPVPSQASESSAFHDHDGRLYLIAFCEIGHICSLVSRIRSDASEEDISQIHALLRNWRSSLPSRVKMQNTLLYWYHEATFGLENACSMLTQISNSLPSSSTLYHLAGGELALSSARDVLKFLASSACIQETGSIVTLTVIAWCIVFTATTCGRGDNDDLALLSIASAFFARMSLSRSVDCGFHEISQLGGIAASMLLKKSYPRKESISHGIPPGLSDSHPVNEDFSEVPDIPSWYQPDTEQDHAPDHSTFISPQKSPDVRDPSLSSSWLSEATVDELLRNDTSFDTSWDNDLMLQGLSNDAGQVINEATNLDMDMIC